MQDAEYIEIPLRSRNGEVIAYALIDSEDAALAKHGWYRNTAGYAVRARPVTSGTRRASILLHREILGLVPGDGLECDHINRDKLDNRRSNLRVVTRAQNQQNVGSNRGASSKYRGVSWFKRDSRWQAYVALGGRINHLGYFDREEDAAEAARVFRAEHMPYSQDARS